MLHHSCMAGSGSKGENVLWLQLVGRLMLLGFQEYEKVLYCVILWNKICRQHAFWFYASLSQRTWKLPWVSWCFWFIGFPRKVETDWCVGPISAPLTLVLSLPMCLQPFSCAICFLNINVATSFHGFLAYFLLAAMLRLFQILVLSAASPLTFYSLPLGPCMLD